MVSLSFSKFTAEDLQYQLAHYKDNRGHVIIATTSCFFFIACFFVALRFFTKSLRKIKYRLEDYLILLALLLACGLWIEALFSVKFGAGKHSLRVFQEHGVDYISKSLQVLFAFEINYNLAHLAIKASILLFYRTIFTFVVRPFKFAWFAIFAYVVANAVASFGVVFAKCQPLRYTWDEPKGVEGKCSNMTTIEIATGVVIALADFMLLVLPMPILWTLRIPRREKVMLCGIFAFGSLALMASIIRVTYLGKIVSGVDFTFIMLNSLIWSILEVNIGIICACTPMIKPLFWPHKIRATTVGGYPANSSITAKIRSKKQNSDNSASAMSLDEYPLARPQGPAGVSLSSIANVNEGSQRERRLDFITAKGV